MLLRYHCVTHFLSTRVNYYTDILNVFKCHLLNHQLKTSFVISRPSAPWYSEEIAAEKRKRRKLERRWRKSGTEANKMQYSDQCSRVRKLLKSSKMSYYASLFNENKSDSKILFNTIDRMLHCTPQNPYPSCGSP